MKGDAFGLRLRFQPREVLLLHSYDQVLAELVCGARAGERQGQNRRAGGKGRNREQGLGCYLGTARSYMSHVLHAPFPWY